jgi:predicted  nucleic acid-binding Zn-ribbon protein
MTKAKQKSHAEWVKICSNLNAALQSAMKHEDELNDDIDHHLSEILKLEEQLTMSVGVIKYLETKIVRPDPI